jgi:hypothetical protein
MGDAVAAKTLNVGSISVDELGERKINRGLDAVIEPTFVYLR